MRRHDTVVTLFNIWNHFEGASGQNVCLLKTPYAIEIQFVVDASPCDPAVLSVVFGFNLSRNHLQEVTVNKWKCTIEVSKLSCSQGKILCSPAHEVENLKPDLIRLELDYYGYLCYTKVMAKSMSKYYLTLLYTMPLIIISLPTFLLVNSFLYTVHKQDSCQYCIVGKESKLLLRYSFIAWRQKCDISSLTEFDDCLYWHF